MGLSDRQKADLMGHAKISIMKDTYVLHGELHTNAAVYLDAAYADWCVTRMHVDAMHSPGVDHRGG